MNRSCWKRSTFCVWWKLYSGIFSLNILSKSSHLEMNFKLFVLFPTQLMVVICSRPSEDRTIPLSVIAERTKLSIENVEHLLMKSLSVSSTLSSLICFFFITIQSSKLSTRGLGNKCEVFALHCVTLVYPASFVYRLM